MMTQHLHFGFVCQKKPVLKRYSNCFVEIKSPKVDFIILTFCPNFSKSNYNVLYFFSTILSMNGLFLKLSYVTCTKL